MRGQAPGAAFTVHSVRLSRSSCAPARPPARPPAHTACPSVSAQHPPRGRLASHAARVTPRLSRSPAATPVTMRLTRTARACGAPRLPAATLKGPPTVPSTSSGALWGLPAASRPSSKASEAFLRPRPGAACSSPCSIPLTASSEPRAAAHPQAFDTLSELRAAPPPRAQSFELRGAAPRRTAAQTAVGKGREYGPGSGGAAGGCSAAGSQGRCAVGCGASVSRGRQDIRAYREWPPRPLLGPARYAPVSGVTCGSAVM